MCAACSPAPVCLSVPLHPLARAGAKTILMTQPLHVPPYRSGWQTVCDILRVEGWRGLYRGCGVTLLRTFVGQGVALTVYPAVHTALSVEC